MLTKKFQEAVFTVKQAEEDADVLIVNTAFSLCSTFNEVFIISEDIDPLVLVTPLASSPCNIYFRKQRKGKALDRLYSANCFKIKSRRNYFVSSCV